YGEQPHHIGAALPKYQTDCCKFNLERSTDPSLLQVNSTQLALKVAAGDRFIIQSSGYLTFLYSYGV
ncbi:hypothetical protein Q8W35_12580, partial [Pseudoalteromonas sp. 1_MG-2023]|nr:hypothetical protein [Pseudoalteromonas sp. 1_MG-2023]